ncbi:putative vacuolar protein-sorting-associated protein 25 [Diaporthe ampelina]|uniref:ESCRT-II complex subunit VPS25 n=1 Tax=Diaporthe ampelina TaxID=1214573 RepID=A0A0G2HPA6_9PEZI|nr:putative vacuolar protein-sorting-associated protein 25 [Diaporthe ampelina]
MASSTSTASASASAPAPAAFEFPREYSFPPFFTRQTNLNTHHAQLVKWSSLVLSYCQHHRIFKLPLSPTASSTSSSLPSAITGSGGNPNASAEDVFFNRKLNRRLALADVREVIDFMRKDGRAEYVGGGDGVGGAAGAGGDVVWVYWRTPEEWAALVEGWVDETAQKGTVLTLYELTEGEGTRGTEFHGLDQDLLQKALNVLVRRGKAQIFGQEDSQGVKFF